MHRRSSNAHVRLFQPRNASTSRAKSIRKCVCPSVRSAFPKVCLKALPHYLARDFWSTTPRGHTQIQTSPSTSAKDCRDPEALGSTRATTPKATPAAPRVAKTTATRQMPPRKARKINKPSSALYGNTPPAAQWQEKTSPKCTMRAKASSRQRWNSSPCAKTSYAQKNAQPSKNSPKTQHVTNASKETLGAQPSQKISPLNSCAMKSPADAPSSPPISTTQNCSR